MKNTLLFFILFTCAFSFAQQDTLFFDKDWKLCKKEEALYYRIAVQQANGVYQICDMYLKTNTPQMIAFSAVIEPPVNQGLCTYYYPNGQKQSEGNYENNKPVGIWVSWTENGKDSTIKDHTPLSKKSNIIKTVPFLYNEGHPFSIALRGKVATFFIIEDVYFFTWSFGTELWYKKHSIGVDASWFRWRYERDNSNDVGMYSQYELRTYLHVDYKYTFLAFERPEIDLYVNFYDKIGRYMMWYDVYEDYDFGTSDLTFYQSNSSGTFNEPGLGLGIRKYAEKTGFGIDGSFNVGYRVSDTNEHNYINATETNFKDHVKREDWLFYIRLNAFFIFGQKKRR